MSITTATLRQRICEAVGLRHAYTTTAAGESDGSTVACTSLDFPDQSLEGWYIKLTSGSTLQTRKIKQNHYNEGIIVPYVAFSAQIATAVTFELFPFNPDYIMAYINEAVRDAFPYLSKQIINDESIVGYNVLPTAVFDEWAVSTYPDYTTLSTATAAEETSTIFLGDSCLKMSTAAGTLYYSSNSWKPLMSLVGDTITYYRLVNTSAASNARIYITTITKGGTTSTEYSSSHSGNGKWESLYVEKVIPSISNPTESSDLAEIRFGCQTQTTDTAYFDKGFVAGTIDEYLMPSEFSMIVDVYVCDNWYLPETIESYKTKFKIKTKDGKKYLWIDDVLGGTKIRLVGYGPFTALSTDASTLNLDTNWERVIEFGALANLLRAQAVPLSSLSISEPMKLADYYQNKFETLKKQYDTRLGSQARKWG